MGSGSVNGSIPFLRAKPCCRATSFAAQTPPELRLTPIARILLTCSSFYGYSDSTAAGRPVGMDLAFLAWHDKNTLQNRPRPEPRPFHHPASRNKPADPQDRRLALPPVRCVSCRSRLGYVYLERGRTTRGLAAHNGWLGGGRKLDPADARHPGPALRGLGHSPPPDRTGHDRILLRSPVPVRRQQPAAAAALE